MSNRPLLLIAGSVVALLFGLIGIISGIIGFNMPVTTADGLTTWPNLIVGLVCLIAAVGFWSRKIWGEYAYGVALAGHIIIQVWLYVGRTASGRVVPPTTTLFLLVMPIISLAVMLDMEFYRRKGVLA